MKKYFRSLAILAVLGVTVFANTLSTAAQSTGIGVSPRKDVNIRPGATFEDRLTINNLNKQVPLKVTLSVVDFESRGETGTPALKLENNAPQTPWSLKPFITMPKTVDVGAGEIKNVNYSVKIPEGQGAGSYYSAIRYTAESASGENVTITASAASLVFVTVPGKATELMNLKEFGAYHIEKGKVDGNYKSLFVGSQPQKLAFTLENRGNVAENPNGSIAIKNIFGKQVKLIENANAKANLALINQTRRFEACIVSQTDDVKENGQTTKVESCKNPGLLPGIYKAQLSAFYGINGSNTQEINATATFWYMPWWFIAVLVVLIALLAFAIFKVRQNLIGATSHRRDKKNKRK